MRRISPSPSRTRTRSTRGCLRLGVEFLSPPNEITAGVNLGGKCCYFKGFDGVHLELLQPPPHTHRRATGRTAGCRLSAMPHPDIRSVGVEHLAHGCPPFARAAVVERLLHRLHP